MAFGFYNDSAPFDEIQQLKTAKEHFEAGTLAIDRGNADFIMAVLYTLVYHDNPCKLVKLPHLMEKQKNSSNQLKLESYEYKSDDVFTNCFVLEGNEVFLVTHRHLTLLDEHLK